MDDSIKTLVDIASVMYENSLNSGKTDSSDEDTVHLVECDLADFMVYLAMSDGVITQDEADEISLMSEKAGLGIDADPAVIAWSAKTGNIFSTEFEKKIPFTFEDAVEHDNYMMDWKGGSEVKQLSKFLLAIYKILGKWFIEMDGEATWGEKRNYDIYIKMLEDYRAANHIVDEDIDEDEDIDDEDEDMDDEDKDTVSNIDDCIKEILARTPVKHGVEAPRKG